MGEAKVAAPSRSSSAVLAAIPAALYLLIALLVVFRGHFNEDAYILFIYVNNLVDLGRISYFEGGERAEGATDFGWMILLAALRYLGVDVGLGAAILNTAGFYLISFVTLYFARQVGGTGLALLYASVGAVSSIAVAGLVGFSTPFYAALSLLLFVVLWRGSPGQLLAVPVLGLILGLVRPDGVILGVAGTFAGLILCARADRLAYLLVSLAAGLVGAAYFYWRWQYFGELLPLPLMVKSEADAPLPGLVHNVQWAYADSILLAFAAFYIQFFAIDRHRILLGIVPALSLVLILTFVVQSQNISFRFQAPLTIVLFLLAVLFVQEFSRRVAARCGRMAQAALQVPVLCALLLPYTANLEFNLDERGRADYSNHFPVLLSAVVEGRPLIVLSEAGRFAFWMPGKKFDLVGLNTRHTARRGADPEYIRRLAPDILFLYTGTTLDFPCEERNYCIFSGATFAGFLDFIPGGFHETVGGRANRAAYASYEYLRSNPDDYYIVTVRYDGGYAHLYAFRRDTMPEPAVIAGLLDTSFSPEGRVSYWEARGRAAARLPAQGR